MKALIYLGAGQNKLEWQEKPDLAVQGDVEAIVRPIASATCDLDREILCGTVPMSQHPGFAIGHECVAEVLEVGDKVRRHKRGDIVVVPCFISCGVCVQCRAGMHTHCTTVSPVASDRVYGLPTERNWGPLLGPCAFADGMLVPVPSGVDPVAVASASDNIVDAYITVRRGMAKHPGAPTLVVGGLDSFGLFVAEQAMAQGSERVDYYDRDPKRRAAARLLGCEVLSEMPEVDRHYPFVVFAARHNAELEPAIRAMAPGGPHSASVRVFRRAYDNQCLGDVHERRRHSAVGVPNSKTDIPAVLEQVRCGHIHPERIVMVDDWTDVPDALYSSDIKPVVVRPTIVNPAAKPARPILPASDLKVLFEGRADDCYARIYQAGANQQTNGPETTRGIGMTKSNKDIALEVLKRAFVDRDPTLVDAYFGANYRQHNPRIPDGPAAIAKMIPTLTGLTYEFGMAVADGDLVMVHGRYTGLGPKPMVVVDIFRIDGGKVVEHWDVMQEEVPAANTASGNAMFTAP